MKKKVVLILIVFVSLFIFNIDASAIKCEYRNLEVVNSSTNNLNGDSFIVSRDNKGGPITLTYTDSVVADIGVADSILFFHVQLDGTNNASCKQSKVTKVNGREIIYFTCSNLTNDYLSCVNDKSCCPSLYMSYTLATRSLYIRTSEWANYVKKDPVTVSDIAEDSKDDDSKNDNSNTQAACTDEQVKKFEQSSEAIKIYNAGIKKFNNECNANTVPVNATQEEYEKYRNHCTALYNGIMPNNGVNTYPDDVMFKLKSEIRKFEKENNCAFDPNSVSSTNRLNLTTNFDYLNKNYETVMNSLSNSISKSSNLTEQQKQELENNVQQDVEKANDAYEKAVITFNDWLSDLFEDLSDKLNAKSCETIIDSRLLEKFRTFMTWFQIAVPILIIVLGSVDFSKAVLFQEKDDLQKAFKTFIKRCIVGVLIFFIPTLLHVLVQLFNKYSDIKLTECLRIFIK